MHAAPPGRGQRLAGLRFSGAVDVHTRGHHDGGGGTAARWGDGQQSASCGSLLTPWIL